MSSSSSSWWDTWCHPSAVHPLSTGDFQLQVDVKRKVPHRQTLRRKLVSGQAEAVLKIDGDFVDDFVVL
jgi:hypothetical protein